MADAFLVSIVALALPVALFGGLGVLVWSVLDDDEGLQEVSDFYRLCGENQKGFDEAAPYGSIRPHPLVFFEEGTEFPVHATDGQETEPDPKGVQLVACASRPVQASDRVSETCVYARIGIPKHEHEHDGTIVIKQYAGKVKITVYEARTGRPVDAFWLSGPKKLKCANIETGGDRDVITVPSTSEYVQRLEEYVTESTKP